MQMHKKRILGLIEDLLLNALSSLKDEEFQRRVWFRNEGPEVSSYGSITIHLLDRCESLFEFPSCEKFLGKENYGDLKKLYELVMEHVCLTESRIIDTDLLQEDELLNNPNWHDIQTLAEKVYIELTELVKRMEHESENAG